MARGKRLSDIKCLDERASLFFSVLGHLQAQLGPCGELTRLANTPTVPRNKPVKIREGGQGVMKMKTCHQQ
ncbi:Hypothetical protein PHPALM_7419 [Phytophthora palmivora]|uniref:Uncharacterized protein n=1 Tax=Phytophthora palmivora TaxID=4796 RepID=A0A2P4YCD0_9STRA|nr:Hypothetical protein PHPALM_7419 [Phytophthora palmivora]